MAAGPHTFATLSVFSPSRFEGSRATVVAARGTRDLLPLETARRSCFAAEFNTDAVAFLFDAPSIQHPRPLDIYVRHHEDYGHVAKPSNTRHSRWNETEFDVNGILAAAHFIFTQIERRTVFSIVESSAHGNDQQITAFHLSKSNINVLVSFNRYRHVAGCLIPNIARLLRLDGPKISWDKILESQAKSKKSSEIEKLSGVGDGARQLPVVSLGERSWVLVDISKHAEVLNCVDRQGIEIDGKAHGLVWFVHQEREVSKSDEPAIEALQIRVMQNGWEEEGGGNAAVVLAAWLSLYSEEDLSNEVGKLSLGASEDKHDKQDGKLSEKRVFAVHTGAAILRPGTIAVEVDVKVGTENKKTIDNIVVSGRAHFLSTGQLIGT